MRAPRVRVSYFAAAALGVALHLLSGAEREHALSDFLFSLASGALIVGLVRLAGNMKAFASLSWGTRFLKRVFLNRFRTGREETEDYASYRRGVGGHTDACPLLIASAALAALSFVVSALH